MVIVESEQTKCRVLVDENKAHRVVLIAIKSHHKVCEKWRKILQMMIIVLS